MKLVGSHHPGLNWGPLAYKASALPLCYGGKKL